MSTLTPHGYRLVYVGKTHHLADVRGYAYEHRVVAERALGRRLRAGEIVHHVNGVKSDNRPENLEVLPGHAEHCFRHRTRDAGLRRPGEPNPDIPCACGCGLFLARYDGSGRPRRFMSGHNTNETGFVGDLLWYLANVPEPATAVYIASFFAVDRGKVTVALSELKRRGKVFRQGRIWRVGRG